MWRNRSTIAAIRCNKIICSIILYTPVFLGPIGFPIVGYMPYLLPAKLFSNMKTCINKYGPIFKTKLGSWDTVFITDYQLIKKAMNHPDFSDRPEFYIFEFASRGFKGLVGSKGELWQEQRRFALRHLRDLGMGKSSIEVHVQREVLDLIQSLKKTLGQPIDLNNSLNIAVTNIVWALVAGKRDVFKKCDALNF